MIKIVSAEFVKGAVAQDGYPATTTVEFAFFGRSNVGKSSLINMIVNRKNLVKTGSRPGMTRQINFFNINNKFVLTDLPGYGYAQRSAEENRSFDIMLAEYASHRTQLKALFFLIDTRRSPTEVETNSIEYFEKLGIEVIIVGTKIDKLSNNDLAKVKRSWSLYFNRAPELMIFSSASSKRGRDELLKCIEARL